MQFCFGHKLVSPSAVLIILSKHISAGAVWSTCAEDSGKCSGEVQRVYRVSSCAGFWRRSYDIAADKDFQQCKNQ